MLGENMSFLPPISRLFEPYAVMPLSVGLISGLGLGFSACVRVRVLG